MMQAREQSARYSRSLDPLLVALLSVAAAVIALIVVMLYAA
jgi:hypothetical protein